MTQEELNEVLGKHKLWINNEPGGERANLTGADLRGADLRMADLRMADLRMADLTDADLRGADLRMADLTDADLRGADLRMADLADADLGGADLRRANLDFSSLPLWCGSLKTTVDKRIACQIAYHFCSLVCDDEEFLEARDAILPFANQFHRVGECGELKPKGAKK
jgi:uncharacterized protein YjbI with pentapeptide repeats